MLSAHAFLGSIPAEWINSVVFFALLGTSLLLFAVRSQYKRLDIDEGRIDFDASVDSINNEFY